MMIAKNAAFNYATKAKAVFALLATTSLVGCTGGLGDALKDIKGDEKTSPSVGAVSAKFEKESGARFKVQSNKIMVPVRFPASVDPNSIDVDAFKVSGCADAILNDVQADPSFDPEKDKYFYAGAEIDVPEGRCTALSKKSIDVELDLSKVRTVSTDEVEAKAGRGTLKASYFTDNEGPVIKEIHVGARKLNFMEMKAFGGLQTEFGFDVNEMPESVTFVFEDTDIDWKSVLRGAVEIKPAGGGFGCAKPPVPGSPIKNINSNSFTVPLSREECGMDTQIEVKVDLTRLADLSGNPGQGDQSATITRALANIAVASVKLKDVVKNSTEPAYLKAGDKAKILVTFDAAVEIESGATPKLSLVNVNADSSAVDCSLTVVDSRTLECEYTVAAGQNGELDYDLAGKIEGLVPAIDAQIGGKDRTVLTALPQKSDLAGKVVVDTEAPTAEFATSAETAGLAGFTLTATFDEPVSFEEVEVANLITGPTPASCAVIENPVLSADGKTLTAAVKTDSCITNESKTVFSLDMTKFADRAGNDGVGSEEVEVSIDTNVPTPSPDVTGSPMNVVGTAEVKLTYVGYKDITLEATNITLEGLGDPAYDTASCEVNLEPAADPEDGIRTIKITKCEGNGGFKVKIAANTAVSEGRNQAGAVEANVTVDNTAPAGTAADIADTATEIVVVFGEEVELATAPAASAKVCSSPDATDCEDATVALDSSDTDNKTVTVTPSAPLTAGAYTIKFTGVTDAAGNAAEDVDLTVTE